MPKETITPSGNLRVDTPDGGPYVPQSPVEISWQRDHAYVQIGVTTPAEQDGTYHLLDVLYGDEASLAHIGLAIRRQRDVIAATMPNPSTVSDQTLGRLVLDTVSGCGLGIYGYYTTFDERRDLNHLLRQLKRARDGAFGRDE